MTTTTTAAAVADPTGTGTTGGTPDNASISERSVGSASASGKSSSSSRKKRSGGNHHRRVMSAVEGSRAQQIMLCGTADGGGSGGGADEAFAAAMHADSISEEGGPMANGDGPGDGGAGLDDWNCAAVTRLPTTENAPPPPISASNTLTCSSLSSTQGGGGTLGDGGTSTLEDLASPGASLSWDNGDDDGFSATGARRSSVEDKLGASATSTFSQSSHSTGNAGVTTPQRRTDTTRVEDTPFLSPPGERSSPGGTSPYGPTSPAVMARIFSDDVGGDEEEVMLAPSAEDNNNDHSNDNGHHHAAARGGVGVSYEDQERRATERDEMVRSCVLELQGQMEEKFSQVLSSQRRDFDRIFALLQAEASRRDSLNSRLHAQLLLQSESMVAMELKVLRLEAKMEKRARTAAAGAGRGRTQSSQQQQYNQHGGGGIMGGIDRVDEEDVPRDIPLVGGALRHGHPSSRRDSMESDDRPVVGDPSALPSRHATSGRPSPTLIGAAFVGSSGASLASGVTATSGEGFMDEEGTVEDEDDDDDAEENADADAEDEDEPGAITNDDSTIDAAVNETDSTPTQSSRQSQNRNRIIGLESVIQQSVNDSALSDTGVSTRAVRPPPDTDGASSLATSVTSATLTSTVVTATTRGSAARTYTSRGDISTHGGSTHGSIHGGSTLGDEHETVTRGTVESVLTSRDGEEDTTISTRVARQENIEMVFGLSPRSGGDRSGYRGDARGDRGSNPPRSRSQSPLTVQDSVAQDSVASASVAASSVGISSTAAVAPSRAFTSRRAAAAAAAAAAASTGDPNRPLTNRVVQFVFNPTIENFAPVEGAGDSVTIPDEIDNLSDVVDVFATSSRRWREDYEARLDAIQKKWTPDQ